MEWLERLDELPRVLQEQLPGMVLYGTQLRCVGSTFLAAGHVLTVQPRLTHNTVSRWRQSYGHRDDHEDSEASSQYARHSVKWI
jgi:hypothetical protein